MIYIGTPLRSAISDGMQTCPSISGSGPGSAFVGAGGLIGATSGRDSTSIAILTTIPGAKRIFADSTPAVIE